jgi:hypothetical protein
VQCMERTCCECQPLPLECRPDETRPSNLTAADGAMSWRNDKPVSQPPAPAAAPQAAAETSAATHGRKEGRSYTASTWEKAPQQPPAPAPEPSQRARAENSTGGQSKGAEASKGSKAVDGEEHWGIGKKTFPERENARRNDGASGDKPHLGGGCVTVFLLAWFCLLTCLLPPVPAG